MTINIEILQNGQLIESRPLADGTYSIGRDSSADIVLESKTVSKNHATLVINKDSFRVVDNGSANGIYCRGEKISEKSFTNNFQIELEPFVIRTAVKDRPASPGKKELLPGAIGFFINRNIKIIFCTVVALSILLSLLILYFPLKNSAESIYQQERLDKGIILSRFLGEMNRPFLESEEHTLIRTSPVLKEDGVVYAFVVDQHGRIIAPHEQQGDFFNWAGLPRALKDKRSKIEKGPNGKTLIFNPIAHQDRMLGAAIIGFAANNAESSREAGISGTTILLLLILLGLSISISNLLTKTFLSPLKRFSEEVEVAIKEGRDHVELQAPYEELDNLKRIVNRLLLRQSAGARLYKHEPVSAEAAVIAKPSVPDTDSVPAEKGASAQNHQPIIDEDLDALVNPWCIVSTEDYTLMRFSATFTTDLGLKECQEGKHIIEVFDSNMIVSVTQIIEDPAHKKLEIEASGKRYQISRTNQPPDTTTVLIVFEETG